MKKIVFALLLLCSNAFGQAGFETGNLTGWTTSGVDTTARQSVVNLCTGNSKCWTINPYGSWMGQLYPSGSVQFNSATTSLGLTTAENTAIRQFMTANAGGGDPTPTDASWMKRTMTLTAGTTYSFAWNYVSTDYTPFNDGSMVTLVHSSNASIIPTLNNSQQRYGLLGFTNPGTGNYATDSYGSTGWQKVTFTVPQTGDYVLGFATFNLGDTALSPMLFVDEIQGTTLINGAAFAPIAPNPGSTAPSATTPTPPAPVVTGTSTSYTTRNVVSGNTTTIYRTPVTTTTYSDNTTTSTNGTEALYQTRVATAVVTNKIVNGVLTTYSTPVVKVTTVGGGASTLESNGSQTVTTQTVNQGLNAQVWRYDPKNYNCVIGICAWNFTYHTPSTNVGSYGGTVNSYRTTNGMFFSTNSNLPNNDNSLFGRNDGTVIRFRGTITAPVTATKPAGTVYRLYFYNNSDDGFKMVINGGTIINQNTTVQLQAIAGSTSNGYMDVVAGQTYNLEAWYWNTYGGLGHTLYWDFGDGLRTIPNSAFTDGTIGNIDIDLTGFNYSNPTLVPIEGTASSLWPESEGIIDSELLQKNSAKGRVSAITLGNSIHIEQKIGSSGNSITIEQSGNYNKIGGLDGSTYAIVDGDNNTVNIKQGSVSGKNLIEFGIVGNTNNVTLWQARNTTTGLGNAADSGGHYTGLNIAGSTNTLSIKQNNDGGTDSGHFAYVDVSGNSNQGSIKQIGNNEKVLFTSVLGNGNIFDLTQQGTGSHYLGLSLTGNGHNVSVNQKESGTHNATINLTNAGGAATVNLVQQGSTGQSINITQQCATLSGCSISVTQGSGP